MEQKVVTLILNEKSGVVAMDEDMLEEFNEGLINPRRWLPHGVKIGFPSKMPRTAVGFGL